MTTDNWVCMWRHCPGHVRIRCQEGAGSLVKSDIRLLSNRCWLGTGGWLLPLTHQARPAPESAIPVKPPWNCWKFYHQYQGKYYVEGGCGCQVCFLTCLSSTWLSFPHKLVHNSSQYQKQTRRGKNFWLECCFPFSMNRHRRLKSVPLEKRSNLI